MAFTISCTPIEFPHWLEVACSLCSAMMAHSRSRRLYHVGGGGWRGERFVVLAQGADVGRDGVLDVAANLVDGLAAGRAAGEVGDVSRIAAVGGFFDHIDVFHSRLTSDPLAAECGFACREEYRG